MIQHFKFENLLMLSISDAGNWKRLGNVTSSFIDCLSYLS